MRGDAVDALHNSTFRILLTHMMEDARIMLSLDLLLVSHNLEHVADLATNIGEVWRLHTSFHYSERVMCSTDGSATEGS